jgi:hypothetical protein
MWVGTRKEETHSKTAKEEQGYITMMPFLPDEQEQCEARGSA